MKYDIVYLLALTALAGYFTYELVLFLESVRHRVTHPRNLTAYRVKSTPGSPKPPKARPLSSAVPHILAGLRRAA